MFMMKYGLVFDCYEWYMFVFIIVFGFGLLVGSVIGMIIFKKVKLYFLMLILIFIVGLLIFVFGYMNVLGVYYVVVFVLGMCIGLINIVIGGWMLKIVYLKLMGCVSGLQDFFMMFVQFLIFGLVVLLFFKFVLNIDYFYYGMGVIILFVFIFYFVVLLKYSVQVVEVNVQEVF